MKLGAGSLVDRPGQKLPPIHTPRRFLLSYRFHVHTLFLVGTTHPTWFLPHLVFPLTSQLLAQPLAASPGRAGRTPARATLW